MSETRAWVLWLLANVVQGLAAYPLATNPGWNTWALYGLSLLLMFGLAAEVIERGHRERIAAAERSNVRMQEQIDRDAALFEILRKVGQR